MTTYPTLEIARQAHKPNDGSICVVEIEHTTNGRCYILARGAITLLRQYANHPSMAEITAFVAQHDLRSAETIKAEQDQWLSNDCTCKRCGCHVDGHTAYTQQEWTRFGGSRIRVTAYYCAACHHMLESMGMGEHTALQDRAGDKPSYEPESKQD